MAKPSPPVGKPRLCKGRCGRAVFGPGARCSRCQAVWRTNKKADKACFPKRKRINPDKRNPAHLEWIRTLPCTILGCPNVESIHAHHVRNGTGGGTAKKPGDEWTVPLCATHHQEGHQRGWLTFEERYGVELRTLASALALASPFISGDQGSACNQ